MSANDLAEYMSVGRRAGETKVRDAKYAPVIKRSYHEPSRDAIREFLGSKIRDWRGIIDLKTRLTARADRADIHPKTREVALNNIAALEAFERGYNAFKLGGLKLTVPVGRQPQTPIEGVRVSINLDLLVHGVGPKQTPLIGGILLHMPKAAEIKTAAAQNRYDTFARHGAAFVHLHCSKHLAFIGSASFKHCFWMDVQRQMIHAAQRDYKTLLSDTEAGCRAIVRAWPDVDPPPGFDPQFAEFVR
jgi:hypothetical protein